MPGLPANAANRDYASAAMDQSQAHQIVLSLRDGGSIVLQAPAGGIPW